MLGGGHVAGLGSDDEEGVAGQVLVQLRRDVLPVVVRLHVQLHVAAVDL